ncbi:hypothetical protein QTG56_07200 [Rossellomorea sp. AcN35-11]|nr:hypothetical protein [Rossellomorea aquimaris]WJV30805.1 hypothetical protein QTG56_07200 [Rossellomorea sp. AcN35-11]
MKKKLIISIIVALFCLMGYSMFYNGFFRVESISIQENDQSFKDGKKTTDKVIVRTITGILNRANKISKTHYKMAIEPTYKIQLEYKDQNKEVLYIYEGFDTNETLIASDNSNNYYKINEKQTKKIIQLLLD